MSEGIHVKHKLRRSRERKTIPHNVFFLNDDFSSPFCTIATFFDPNGIIFYSDAIHTSNDIHIDHHLILINFCPKDFTEERGRKCDMMFS